MRKRVVLFCRHARLKFRILRLHRFPVTEKQVREAVLDPEKRFSGYKDRKIAERTVDSGHALRVVYEDHGDIMEVVTFYPVRRKH